MIKTQILFVIFYLPLCTFVSAQKKIDIKKWSYGALFGYQPYGKMFAADEWKTTSGIVAGLNTQYNFTENLTGLSIHFQPQFNHFQRASESGSPQSSLHIVTKWKAQSINLPFLVRYTLGKGLIRPFLEAGPNFRFRTGLGLKETGYLCGIARCSERNVNIDLHPQTTQDRVGVIVGAGAEVNLSKIAIPISLRINEGFGTFGSKQLVMDAANYTNLKTPTFQIISGITF
ncbi:outer membrane beta-barrel protein [Dyadobacter sp. 32]|uniref:outer membrane beta-barrel protein n=1 Tax=Dyadobacter sp. 32 TaxID=538966 RepID=UPI0011F0257A